MRKIEIEIPKLNFLGFEIFKTGGYIARGQGRWGVGGKDGYALVVVTQFGGLLLSLFGFCGGEWRLFTNR